MPPSTTTSFRKSSTLASSSSGSTVPFSPSLPRILLASSLVRSYPRNFVEDPALQTQLVLGIFPWSLSERAGVPIRSTPRILFRNRYLSIRALYEPFPSGESCRVAVDALATLLSTPLSRSLGLGHSSFGKDATRTSPMCTTTIFSSLVLHNHCQLPAIPLVKSSVSSFRNLFLKLFHDSSNLPSLCLSCLQCTYLSLGAIILFW
eukprot:GILI01044041.1.p1 GENE.GILI01044041.1~~GILI01044041.1.p1  ORF type:complete len:205 (+),score=4.55 GILI01044041.1:329-943(+)